METTIQYHIISEEDLVVEINGTDYKLEKPVFSLLINLSLEKDKYKKQIQDQKSQVEN